MGHTQLTPVVESVKCCCVHQHYSGSLPHLQQIKYVASQAAAGASTK